MSTQTKYGECPTHGHVQATREMPAMSWPFIVSAVRRLSARKKPYTCPTCGSEVQPSQ